MTTPASSSSAAHTVDTSAASPLRTFLVEDNSTIRESLQAALDELVGITLAGFASDERSACQALTQPPTDWDLAIVDIALREGTGFGVLQACRNRRPDRKMVVLSNYATPAVRERCLALGADAVFDKSTDIDALVDYCRSLRPAR